MVQCRKRKKENDEDPLGLSLYFYVRNPVKMKRKQVVYSTIHMIFLF